MSSSHQDAVNIFSRVIRLWVVYVQIRDRPDIALKAQAGDTHHDGMYQGPSIVVSHSFHDREKSLLFRKIENSQRRGSPLNDRPLHNIIEFATTVAKHSLTLRWGIFDAGILALVPLVIADGIPSLLSPLVDTLGRCINRNSTLPSQQQSHPFRTEAAAYDTNPTTFPLALISTAASNLLSSIQAPRFQEFLHSEMFITRKRICSALLDTFLGDDCGMVDVYSEIRDIFAEILAEPERDTGECQTMVFVARLTHLAALNSIVPGDLKGLMGSSIWKPFATPNIYLRYTLRQGNLFLVP
jgi:hypothetical protein